MLSEAKLAQRDLGAAHNYGDLESLSERSTEKPDLKLLTVNGDDTRPTLGHLLPLNRCRRFAGDIKHDPVDAFNLINDAVAHAAQERFGQKCPVGSHTIF